MPSTLKRKGSPSSNEQEESSKRRFAETERSEQDATAETGPQDKSESQALQPEILQGHANDRAARFAALRARNTVSRKSNLAETKNEAKRASIDPSQLVSINRKKEIASHKLLKAEIEESGEDFERKRAWDWTVEESEKWDQRLEEKKWNKEKNLFQDYSQEAGKVYERQISQMGKSGMDERLQTYEQDKREAISRAIQSGELEIAETADGELIAIDKDGSSYSTAESTSFAENKPSRAAIDRLVSDMKKADEIRLKKRRERGRPDEDGNDVTYINEKNKQFNMKLARFYNKYTADIRESFERGTAI